MHLAPNEFVGATCGSDTTTNDIGGVYSPIGSHNGRVLYRKTSLGSNGYTWYMHYDDVQAKWVLVDSQNPWPTIEEFNSELLG